MDKDLLTDAGPLLEEIHRRAVDMLMAGLDHEEAQSETLSPEEATRVLTAAAVCLGYASGFTGLDPEIGSARFRDTFDWALKRSKDFLAELRAKQAAPNTEVN